MTNDVFQALLSDCLLAVVLFVLFAYVARLSRNLRGILTWGAAHLVYTVGATSIDAIAPAFLRGGYGTAAWLAVNLGGVLACSGMVGLAWSMVQFARQRSLRRWEQALLPVAVALSVLAWVLRGNHEAQGIALSVVEIGALALMIWHLRALRARADRLPAGMMIAGCVLLVLLYGSAIPGWAFGRFGLADIWVSADLSIWFMLNFCMLMLTSFHAAESLRRSAMSDPLTGALNRRGLDAELELLRRAGGDARLAVIALDLDDFKSVNDGHGHETGDLVLRCFGDAVRECICGDDLFARLGGEEFVVAVPDADADGALQLAQRIRARVETLALPAPAPPIAITVSLGVCVAGAHDAFTALLRCADEALYAAKRNGRNRVEMHDFVA